MKTSTWVLLLLSLAVLGLLYKQHTMLGKRKRASSPIRRQLFAVGDIHGCHKGLVKALKLTGAVDHQLRWVGSDMTVVMLGDITDRGPDTKQVIATIRRLQGEATANGSRLVQLLGNHEMMNLLHDTSFVSPEEMQSYGSDVERQVEFSPLGSTGQWLRQLPTVHQEQGVVFVHAGIEPAFAKLGVDGINQLVWQAWKNPVKGRWVLGEHGPLWTRVLSMGPEKVARPMIETSLHLLGAQTMVVGHTNPSMVGLPEGKIGIKYDGQYVMADLGISSVLGGHIGVVEVLGDGTVRGVY